jgi:hypothetical protein
LGGGDGAAAVAAASAEKQRWRERPQLLQLEVLHERTEGAADGGGDEGRGVVVVGACGEREGRPGGGLGDVGERGCFDLALVVAVERETERLVRAPMFGVVCGCGCACVLSCLLARAIEEAFKGGGERR